MNIDRICRGAAFALLGIVLAACTEKDFAEEDDFDWVSHTPVTLSVSDMYVIEEGDTRGTGAMGAIEGETDESVSRKLMKSYFHVYAFRSKNTVDMTVAAAGDEMKDDCLLDDEDNYYSGCPARLDAQGSGKLILVDDTVSGTPSPVYFGPNVDNAYNFFVYYLDDIPQNEVTVHRDKSMVGIDVTIDGSQDIMYGSSYPLTYGYLKNFDLTDEERKRISDMGGGYSAYSYHRNIMPSVELKHCFTRLRFKAFPGDEGGNNITINAVSVKACPQGRLTVASVTRADLGYRVSGTDYVDMYLHDKYEGGKTTGLMKPVRLPEYDPTKSMWEQEGVMLGESLLLPPARTYNMTVHYTETITDEEGNTVHKPMASVQILKLSTSEMANFRAGNTYTVNLSMYGAVNAQTRVKVNDWQEVDSVWRVIKERY